MCHFSQLPPIDVSASDYLRFATRRIRGFVLLPHLRRWRPRAAARMRTKRASGLPRSATKAARLWQGQRRTTVILVEGKDKEEEEETVHNPVDGEHLRKIANFLFRLLG